MERKAAQQNKNTSEELKEGLPNVNKVGAECGPLSLPPLTNQWFKSYLILVIFFRFNTEETHIYN